VSSPHVVISFVEAQQVLVHLLFAVRPDCCSQATRFTGIVIGVSKHEFPGGHQVKQGCKEDVHMPLRVMLLKVLSATGSEGEVATEVTESRANVTTATSLATWASATASGPKCQWLGLSQSRWSLRCFFSPSEPVAETMHALS